MPWETRSGWIASISELSRIASWKLSFSIFLNITLNRQTSLQASIAQKDSWYLLYILAGIEYHKKGVSEWYAAGFQV